MLKGKTFRTPLTYKGIFLFPNRFPFRIRPSKDGQNLHPCAKERKLLFIRQQAASLKRDKHVASFHVKVSIRSRRRKSYVIIFIKPFIHYHHPSPRFSWAYCDTNLHWVSQAKSTPKSIHEQTKSLFGFRWRTADSLIKTSESCRWLIAPSH
jgi:hypothetical protein